MTLLSIQTWSRVELGVHRLVMEHVRAAAKNGYPYTHTHARLQATDGCGVCSGGAGGNQVKIISYK